MKFARWLWRECPEIYFALIIFSITVMLMMLGVIRL